MSHLIMAMIRKFWPIKQGCNETIRDCKEENSTIDPWYKSVNAAGENSFTHILR
jgi:hypothetical protein